jgi:hypothetical protein
MLSPLPYYSMESLVDNINIIFCVLEFVYCQERDHKVFIT